MVKYVMCERCEVKEGEANPARAPPRSTLCIAARRSGSIECPESIGHCSETPSPSSEFVRFGQLLPNQNDIQ